MMLARARVRVRGREIDIGRRGFKSWRTCSERACGGGVAAAVGGQASRRFVFGWTGPLVCWRGASQVRSFGVATARWKDTAGTHIEEERVPGMEVEELDGQTFMAAQEEELGEQIEEEDLRPEERMPPLTPAEQLEHAARRARNRFGDTLPQHHLSQEEYAVYERLYGPPLRITTEAEAVENEAIPDRTVLLREGEHGILEEVEYTVKEQTTSQEQDDEALQDLLEQVNQRNAQRAQSTTEETLDEFEEEDEMAPVEEFPEDVWPGDEFIRTHPLTLSSRYGTTPSTLLLPKSTFIDPIADLMTSKPTKQLQDVAQRAFGGVGLPYSPSTPRISRTMVQKPIGLSAGQSRMTDMEADVYLTCVMPQVYASVMGVLVEVRKRLGEKWLRGLLAKEGGPLILDAGSGGAGVIAWREVLKAEWAAMHEAGTPEETDHSSSSEIPLPEPPPYGKATVLTASDTLRHRSSKLLQNTTFLPRLPDAVTPSQLKSDSAQPRKQYDIIIAPHTLWPIKEDYMRKNQVKTLWSLLNPDGGILVLMEKGVPRGFEIVAGAREMLLKRHISSPGATHYATPLDAQKADVVDDDDAIFTPASSTTASSSASPLTPKETGCIIAPCTNHAPCPLYTTPGVSRGRKDWCYFSQRYTRPPFLQGILGAKARNFDDVEVSYLVVQRGVDQRRPEGDSLMGRGFGQGVEATERAFEGFGPKWVYEGGNGAGVAEESTGPETTLAEKTGAITEQAAYEEPQSEDSPPPHPLSLPRTLLTPLKRKGHILIDVCTPSGTLERWMVSRSRPGKQAYRDARKAKWGDLWALGAKSRTERRVRLGRAGEERSAKDVKGKGKRVKQSDADDADILASVLDEGDSGVEEMMGGRGVESMKKKTGKSVKGKWKYKGGKGGKKKGPERIMLDD